MGRSVTLLCLRPGLVVTLIFPQTLGTEGRLPDIKEHFAHVLLFACPECERPLASACASGKKNLEEADAHFFNPHCHCGWSGPVAGMEAVKHWVQAWREFKPEAGAARPSDGSCDGKTHTG